MYSQNSNQAQEESPSRQLDTASSAKRRKVARNAARGGWHPSFERKFGVVPGAVDPDAGVVSAVCKFCGRFGREEVPETARRATLPGSSVIFDVIQNSSLTPGGRKSTGHVKRPPRLFRSVTGRLRTDNSEQHHRMYHSKKWRECQIVLETGGDAWTRFFCDGRALMQMQIDLDSRRMSFTIEKRVMHNVLVPLVSASIRPRQPRADSFDEEDYHDETEVHEEMTLTRLRRPFVTAPSSQSENYSDSLLCDISGKPQFSLIVSLLCLQPFISSGSQSSVYSVSSAEKSWNFNVVAYINQDGCPRRQKKAFWDLFDVFEHILRPAWAYSLAIDGGDEGKKLDLLDIRVRFYESSEVVNMHIVALPMSDSHTSRNIKTMIDRVMDALDSMWREKLIGFTRDGATNMVGRNSGVATLLEESNVSGMYRLHCGAHQLNLVIGKSVGNLRGFVPRLHKVVPQLRLSRSLHREMNEKCPRHVATRWTSLGTVLSWLVAKFRNRRVQVCLMEKHSSVYPESFSGESPETPASIGPETEDAIEREDQLLLFWVVLFGLEDMFAVRIVPCFQSLQGKETVLKEQRRSFLEMIKGIERDWGTTATSVVNWESGITENAPRMLLKKHQDRRPVAEMLQIMSVEKKYEAAHAMLGFAARVVSDVSELITTQDRSSDAPPNIFPEAIASMSPREFICLLSRHKERLSADSSSQAPNLMNSEARVDRIYEERLALCRLLQQNEHMLLAVRNVAKRSFCESWQPLGNRFPALDSFCGGITTVMSTTATVKAISATLDWKCLPLELLYHVLP